MLPIDRWLRMEGQDRFWKREDLLHRRLHARQNGEEALLKAYKSTLQAEVL